MLRWLRRSLRRLVNARGERQARLTTHTNDDRGGPVERGAKDLFGHDAPKAMAILKRYTGPEQARVRAAALRESGGHLSRLREAVDVASVDYRDLLAYSEPGGLPRSVDHLESEKDYWRI